MIDTPQGETNPARFWAITDGPELHHIHQVGMENRAYRKQSGRYWELTAVDGTCHLRALNVHARIMVDDHQFNSIYSGNSTKFSKPKIDGHPAAFE
ncbi:hypothetical protein [Paenarthrobacter sp. TA1.8]|uniref:hypothetical protein n=1 Tax=Paenarthrobacter sp. TA1.8 TaxID=3400219 RepID=UPI003B436EC7